jgi:serine protease Do
MKSSGWFVCLCSVALACAGGAIRGDEARRTPVVDAVQKTRPCIVTLKIAKGNVDGETPERTGTGVIVDPRGYIVTSRHLIANAAGIRVTLPDRTALAARVVAAEPDIDLALLQVRPTRTLPALTPASGRDLLVGEPVIAIGHPYGYDYTVSTGIISGLGRRLTMPSGDVLSDVIQFDAAINPGNSGGPLLNVHGEWIGLNTAMRDGAHGIAFALNIETVKAMLHRHLDPDAVDAAPSDDSTLVGPAQESGHDAGSGAARRHP